MSMKNWLLDAAETVIEYAAKIALIWVLFLDRL